MLFKSFAVLAAVASAVAQRPDNTSICDYYTTALLKDNTAANQMKLLTLVVNTAVIGNYTKPNVGIAVPGILAPGTFNGTQVNLLPYFNGMLLSTNDGGSSGVSQSFLDDGGAAPLKMSMPSNGNTTSNQYMLLTHLYEFFGVLLGCSQQGNDAYPAYAGEASMYQVHKFMALDPNEVGYFITQVGLSAASFGVTQADVTAVGTALGKLFGYRCSPPTTVVKAQGPQLQSICTDASCPLSANATCNLEDNNGVAVAPQNASSSSGSSGSNSTASASGSSSASGTSSGSPAMATKSDATALQAGLLAVMVAGAMAVLSI